LFVYSLENECFSRHQASANLSCDRGNPSNDCPLPRWAQSQAQSTAGRPMVCAVHPGATRQHQEGHRHVYRVGHVAAFLVEAHRAIQCSVHAQHNPTLSRPGLRPMGLTKKVSIACLFIGIDGLPQILLLVVGAPVYWERTGLIQSKFGEV
jgi:hypothetical protein